MLTWTDWLTDWLTGCTHIVRGGAIIINFPAKLNFNAFAAAEMKTKIASIGKIAKKSSGCCALDSMSVWVCVCLCWQFYWAPTLPTINKTKRNCWLSRRLLRHIAYTPHRPHCKIKFNCRTLASCFPYSAQINETKRNEKLARKLAVFFAG